MNTLITWDAGIFLMIFASNYKHLLPEDNLNTDVLISAGNIRSTGMSVWDMMMPTPLNELGSRILSTCKQSLTYHNQPMETKKTEPGHTQRANR